MLVHKLASGVGVTRDDGIGDLSMYFTDLGALAVMAEEVVRAVMVHLLDADGD